MKFEKGKKYVFTEKQFNIGRDSSNRLIFILPDAASTQEYRIVAFDFQKQKPERITCIYNGTRLEQDPYSVAAQLYKPGEEYTFYINSDIRLGKCTLRDEINDVTYKNVKIGKTPFKRFDRIRCRIDQILEDRLELTPVMEARREDNLFRPEDVAALPEGRYLRNSGILQRMLASDTLGGAARLLEDGDSRWVIKFLEECLAWCVDLIRRRELTKEYVLRGLELLAVALIERSDYVSLLPADQQTNVQQRLEAVAQNAADYRAVYNMIRAHEADSVLNAILGSLEKSARFYRPEQKVRTLKAMITLEAVDVRPYISRLIDIVSEHHGNTMFMQYFRHGVLQLLRVYITSRQDYITYADREELRLLIRAMATEQLLYGSTGNRDIERRRGLLYSCAAMLINSSDNELPRKALLSFAGLVKAKPEFSWSDLGDAQRLCYAYLNQPFEKGDLRDATALFENNSHCITVSDGVLGIRSSTNAENLKKISTYELSPGMACEIYASRRITGLNNGTADENPAEQSKYMKRLERAILEVDDKPQVQTFSDLRLEEGDHTTIRVVRQVDNNLFDCVIVDPAYKGRGLMGVHDIVAYDVHCEYPQFMRDGVPLLFDVTVRGILRDGNYLFSMRSNVNAHCLQKANLDHDIENDVRCIVTGVYKEGSGYFALSENGYPMVVWMPRGSDFLPCRGDILVARIENVASNNDNLFVKASYQAYINPETADDGDMLSMESIFGSVVQAVASGTYEADDSDDDSTAVPVDTTNYISMNGTDTYWLMRMVNRLSAIGTIPLARRYALLWRALLMADIVESSRIKTVIEAKLGILEELGNFAVNSSVNLKTLEQLEEECRTLVHKDLSLDNCLEILRILSGIDNPDTLPPATYPADTIQTKVRRLVIAYNQIWGMGLNAARTEIMKGIYDLLRLPQSEEINVECLKVQEDERNEFKQSIIYPADNNMHADDRRQGREIMEVVAGMMNHNGGTIYLGVNNQGFPMGLDNDFRFLNNNSDKYDLRDIQDKFALHFHYFLRTHIGQTFDGRPVTDYVHLSFDTLGDKQICRVVVEPFPVMVRMKDGKVYHRQDSSTLPLPVAEQAAFASHRAQLGAAREKQSEEKLNA